MWHLCKIYARFLQFVNFTAFATTDFFVTKLRCLENIPALTLLAIKR